MPGLGYRRMDNMADYDSETDLTTASAAMQKLAAVSAATAPILTQRFCAHPSHDESSWQDDSLYGGRLNSGYIGCKSEWVAAEESPQAMVEGAKKRLRHGLSISPSASTSQVSMDEPPAPVNSVLTGLKRLRVASTSSLCSQPLEVGWDEEKSGRSDPPQGWQNSNPQHEENFLEQQNIYPQDEYKEEEKLQEADNVYNDRYYYGADVQNRYFRGIRVQAGIHDVNYGQANSLLRQLHLERVSNRAEP